MQRLMVMLLLLGGLTSPCFAEDNVAAEPARLANGTSIEGTLQETTAEGMSFQTPKGLVIYPWKYLSAGTRYRFERPFLAKMEAGKTNVADKASAAVAAKAASTNVTLPVVGKEPATNTPAKMPGTPPQKKKSRNIP